MFYYYTIATLCFISSIQALQLALINCSWPCPNASHECIVTSTTTFCGNREMNSWMMNTPEKSPSYTGAYVSIHLQPCQSVPIPLLPIIDNTTSIQPGQAIIEWPITSNSRKPQDAYLGNCGHGLYCSSIGDDKLVPVCRQKLSNSIACNSSNQCISKHCIDNICQVNNSITKKEDQFKQHHHVTHPSHSSTGHILAAVFGVFGAVVIAAVAFFIYRKRKQKNLVKVPPSEHNNTTTQSTTTSFNINRDSDLIHKQFASDFQQETTTVQQQQDYIKPPPLYKP